MKIAFIIAMVVVSLVVLFYITKMKKRLSKFLLMFCSGLAAMLIINLTSGYTSLSIPVNPYTVAVASVLGIPGDAALLIINHLL